MTTSLPRLSILVPAFNCRDTIVDTLQSLDDIETGWDFISEVIVCDDCSTDDTVHAIGGASFRNFDVKLLKHTRTQGEGACYTTMVESLEANVDWFLILHSDDLALSCFIDRNVAIIKLCEPRVAAVSSNYYSFGNGVERLGHPATDDKIIWRASAPHDIEHTALVGTWWHISGSLVRKSAWVEHGGRDTSLPQLGDWDLMLRWQCAHHLIGHSLIPTTRYRLSDASVSSKSYIQFRDLRERIEIINRHRRAFPFRWRMKIGGNLALTGIRRAAKLTLQGHLLAAARGMGVTGKALVNIVTGYFERIKA